MSLAITAHGTGFGDLRLSLFLVEIDGPWLQRRSEAASPGRYEANDE